MISWKRTNLISLTLAAFVAGCSHEEPATTARVEAAEQCPRFTTGAVKGMYCQVSVFALLADPARYAGRKVFTYGYLVKTNDGQFTLVVEPRYRRAPDVVSCIGIHGLDAGSDERLEEMVPLRFYSVALGGTFSRLPPGACVGQLEAVEVSQIGAEDL